MDQIHVRDLLLRTIVGINDEERENRQDVLINISLTVDTRAAGRSDRIADAVNYRTITKRVIRMVEASRFYLVERLAAEVAAICLADARVEAARVVLEKPGALRFARSVGVEIVRTRAALADEPNRAFVALGSNIDPERNLGATMALFREQDQVTVTRISPVYETVPVGSVGQAKFLNAAVLLTTPLSARDLKDNVLSGMEHMLGRVRTSDKNAPRTIDLDIVLFNYDVFEIGLRHVPDPDLLRYAHVAVPVADLAPYYVHPETGETLAEIAAQLGTAGMQLREDLDLVSLAATSTTR